MKAISDNRLIQLRRLFQSDGFDVRVVGGSVRDFVRGIEPKDIDLCTDANPDQMVALFTKHGLRFIPTGIAHGTITVVLDGEPFEITSLRLDTDTDGRHATVVFTNDWVADAARRDLTINAMSLTFDGDIVDPFGGQDDLANNRVRFVGAAKARMQEDYLRILRWLRFHARIAPDASLDLEAVNAALEVGAGLKMISRERVWAEVSKILVADGGFSAFSTLFELRLAEQIDLPVGDFAALKAAMAVVRDPVVMLAVFLGDKVAELAANWKWSSAERDKAVFIATNRGADDLERMVALRERPLDWVVDLAMVDGRADAADFLKGWDAPVFPVGGGDLIARGVKPGKAMGEMLGAMRQMWVSSRFTATKDRLLAGL